MYAVVGCSECSALWVVETDVESSQCRRCGKQHRLEKLKQFVTTEDEDHAREVRASMLAARSGEGDAYAEMDAFGEMDDDVTEAGMSDEAFMAASGVDTEAVAAAGERAESGSGGSQSRRETVLAALADLEEPTEADVVAYAGERGVSEAYAREALERLARAGEVTERDGVYRRL